MSRHLLASAAILSVLAAARAEAQSVTINGDGTTLLQPTYDSEFTQFTSSNPTVTFTYTTPSGFFQQGSLEMEPASIDFVANDVPLISSQLGSLGDGGAPIQIPMVGLAETIPFVNNGVGNTTLSLTGDQLCGIFSGRITQWSQLSSTATHGTITIVYRSDQSSSTRFLSQHLDPICTTANSNFSIPLPVTSTFADLFANNQVPANFVAAAGSGAEAGTLQDTPLSLGYVSPDYTSIAPESANATSLKVAALVNATDGKAYLPTLTNISLGLAHPGPGSTNATPPTTLSTASNPADWVPTIPDTTAGYPIVADASWELATCYADKPVGTDLVAFLEQHYGPQYTKLLNVNGFVAVQNTSGAPFITAVKHVFLTNASHDNLDIDNNSACKHLSGR